MDIFEFHRRLGKYCEKKEQEAGENGAVNCTKVCKMAGYCYRAPSETSEEIVKQAISLLESER